MSSAAIYKLMCCSNIPTAAWDLQNGAPALCQKNNYPIS